MRKLGFVMVSMMLAGGSLAYAQKAADKAKAPQAAQPAKEEKVVAPAEPVKMEPPKPSAELEKVKFLAANWNCDGKGMLPDGSAQTSYKSSLSGKWDLGKFWLALTYAEKKSKTNPMAFNGKAFVGYEAGSKKFVFFGADDMGGMINLWSTGWDAAGTAMVFAGDATMAMGKMPFRITFTKGDTEKKMVMKIEGQMQGTWTTFGENTCKR